MPLKNRKGLSQLIAKVQIFATNLALRGIVVLLFNIIQHIWALLCGCGLGSVPVEDDIEHHHDSGKKHPSNAHIERWARWLKIDDGSFLAVGLVRQ